jgi:glutaredoxin 3
MQQKHLRSIEEHQMKIVMYTKSACPNCEHAKQLLQSKKLSYVERNVDDPSELMAFNLRHPDIRQMPQIFIDDQRVGGLAGLQAALKQVGL